jgi:hypothetical protein
MKRWILLALVVVVAVAAFLALRINLTPHSQRPQYHLARTPNSAYKYNLCTEAFAFAFAPASNPYKTDYSFPDPFRNTSDTITPTLQNLDQHDDTVSFSVQIIIRQVATFTESISHVRALDGISILLPDKQDHLQRSSVPQFIVSYLAPNASASVLDYTCPAQWVWKIIRNS